ncbi:MAG: cation transporter [Candidatus Theseobacter exili]|nr:cation transporter [Candidatus Theseobacter exili]
MSTHKHSHLNMSTSTRLIVTFALNLIITVVEIAGGILSGSLSLLSDALHNFSDAIAIVISYIAIRLSKSGKSERYTFGLKELKFLQLS